MSVELFVSRVERVWLDKDDEKQRPIGKPTCEDKIVQRAVVMLWEVIDAQDFCDSSYGFRQGRSPHDALHEVRERCMTEGIGWIVDADVGADFDSRDKTDCETYCGNGSRMGASCG